MATTDTTDASPLTTTDNADPTDRRQHTTEWTDAPSSRPRMTRIRPMKAGEHGYGGYESLTTTDNADSTDRRQHTTDWTDTPSLQPRMTRIRPMKAGRHGYGGCESSRPRITRIPRIDATTQRIGRTHLFTTTDDTDSTYDWQPRIRRRRVPHDHK
jgi:hypothetical protein